MKVVQNVVPFIVFFTLIVPLCFTEHKNRLRRRVVFVKDSKFFMRLNGRINMLNYTTIFAHGWGFKIAYDLPTTMSKKKLFFKRNSDFNLEDFYSSWFDKVQFYHIMDQICKHFLRDSTRRCGVSCKIQNIINSSNGTDGAFFQSFIEKCNHYSNKYSQMHVTLH
ncbi:uncharacterized protein LOC108735624 [Agrilus planipennis]|uniref:Uncharacterized protein LOC108735624 n=1 Tax=Agrilus planipennis TaxID=224129 RepID=A0A1W4WRP2_AGRPL|nr:uncharacterized protein LOC108735624 [Agrilus planipennis]